MESSPDRSREPPEASLAFISGLCLAILSTIFIGSSFIIKKLSLLRLSRKGALRAGAGGYGYLKDWMWWLGLITMGIGELANFVAYSFAPASLVTPLGALSVLVSAILASKFLKETLSVLGKVGCLLCILGSIVIILHAPKEQEILTVEDLLSKLQNPVFINYLCVVLIISLVIIFYLGPRYGSRHVLIYITLCSAVGSVIVMACKGLGLAISQTLSDQSSDLSQFLVYILFIVVVVCIFIQMNYLNKALDLFSASVVTPVYYVVFTTLVIIASAILFEEWREMTVENVLGTLCGFFVVIVAIFLLQTFKDNSDFENSNKYKQRLVRTEYGLDTYIARIM